MALKKTAKTEFGFDVENAYHRVEGVVLKDKETISFNLRAYKDATPGIAALADQGFSCSYDINGENPVKQSYEFLKNSPEFAGATDC